MSSRATLRLEDVRRAWAARDPDLVRLAAAVAEEDRPAASGTTEAPIREGAVTFDKFIAEVRAKAFHKKPKAEQAQYRVAQLAALESPSAEVPLSDRLRLHELILELWADNGPFARRCLLELIGTIELKYGPWKALKRIFKEAEARGDTEVWGALTARFDAAHSGGLRHWVSKHTVGYLCRRAWRTLRRTGQTLPAAYADVACDVLAAYTDDDTAWERTWVANHVFYHEAKKYSRTEFSYSSYNKPGSLTKHRAFAEAWQRTPRPLFALLERAKSDKVRQFAAECLKTDFRTALREVDPAWVARLAGVGSEAVDDFVVWILSNVPRFEQSAFRTLNLHDTVLRLFGSKSEAAAAYAAAYARTHARDLPVPQLIRLANSSHEPVRKLAADLLNARDPRTEVGLEAWGQLLDTEEGHELAAAAIRKHFGPKELTPAWFAARLFSSHSETFDFARDLLPHVHPYAKLGAAYFADLIDRLDALADGMDASNRNYAAYLLTNQPQPEYLLDQLARFDLNALDPEFLRRLFAHPLTRARARQWVDQGKLNPKSAGADYFKALAYAPAWETDPWAEAFRKAHPLWADKLAFDEEGADAVLQWMRDVRVFAPSDLGFDWLMKLVARTEPRYHDFAVEVMTKAFVPADFAPAGAVADASASAAPSKPATVDLKGASFVFTGTLATMSRKEAQQKVTGANGLFLDAVSSKLHYLVIGDEGSPLYGQGKKGSKQVKAEQINAGGGNVKIISETAFLKMLAGQQQEASGDATAAGLERLWQMATAPGGVDAPVAAFARRYLRRHHPAIALAETERPVDPGAEVPASFLTFARVRPLLADSRKAVREFGLLLARWEFARWGPPADEIVRLSELPFDDVRQFVSRALLADDAPEHKTYRIDPAVMTPEAAYGFVESAEESTRELGMELIRRQPRLRLPRELFRLTESPDRRVRAFVINALRALYRDRGITEDWKPTVPPRATIGATAKKAAAAAVTNRGDGAPSRPDHLPAEADALRQFLRQTLFELPPGRLPPRKGDDGEAAEPAPAKGKSKGKPPADGEPLMRTQLKPLPARKAKLALIETLRDVAVADAGFAAVVLPLLEEFLAARGQSEHAATLVAVTRIRAARA